MTIYEVNDACSLKNTSHNGDFSDKVLSHEA